MKNKYEDLEQCEKCKWLRNGDECGKGLPGTPCEIVGCVACEIVERVAWEHYEPADAMKYIDEKIKLVSEKKTWEGVDVDKYLAEIRGKDTELYRAASDLVDAVERYMRQECLRSELAMKKDKLKALLHE